MSDVILPGKKLVHLHPQPEFPCEDVLDDNAAVVGTMLEKDPGVIGQSAFLRAHQRVLHHIATTSMRRGGVHMETDPETYEGFTLGFATLEYVVMLLKGKAIDVNLAARQFAQLLPTNPFMEDPSILESFRFILSMDDVPKPILSEAYVFDDEPEAVTPEKTEELFAGIVDADRQSSWAERYTTWPDRRPNTFALVMQVAEAHSGSLRYAAAALLGAQTVTELQDQNIAA